MLSRRDLLTHTAAASVLLVGVHQAANPAGASALITTTDAAALAALFEAYTAAWTRFKIVDDRMAALAHELADSSGAGLSFEGWLFLRIPTPGLPRPNHAELLALWESSGLAEIQRQHDALEEEICRLFDALNDARPRDLAGLVVKLRFALFVADRYEDRPLEDDDRDLSEALLARALQDAERLTHRLPA